MAVTNPTSPEKLHERELGLPGILHRDMELPTLGLF